MKKVILLVVVMFAVTTLAQAQLVRVGAKAGLSVNSSDFDISGDFADAVSNNVKNKAGYHLGMMARVQLVGLYVQGDVLYRRDSYTYELSSSEDLSVKSNSLDIPVVAGMKLLFLRIYAGPRFNFDLGNKIEKTSTHSSAIDAALDSSWLGYQAGVGLDLFKRFALDVSYNGYFKSANQKFDVDGDAFTAKQKNKQIWFTLGYYFGGRGL